MIKSYSFDGCEVKIELENGKTYKAYMGGLFYGSYAAFFGFLVAEIEYAIGKRADVPKLRGMTWNEMWAIKDELVDHIKSTHYLDDESKAHFFVALCSALPDKRHLGDGHAWTDGDTIFVDNKLLREKLADVIEMIDDGVTVTTGYYDPSDGVDDDVTGWHYIDID